MKPIAVVHWIEKGEERSKPCYEQNRLERLTQILKDENRVFWTCLCDGRAIAPKYPSR